jgi:glycosyltransferase involved in cell wall biosynthesis
MPGLSVTVIVHNEAHNIVPCLESAAWADEIVVLDSGSTDGTVELARQFTPKVFTVQWQGFGRTKNQALDLATMPWVFVLDADERLTPELRQEIQAVLAADGPADGYRVPRRNFFCGRFIKYLGWYPDYSIRLFRRDKGRFGDREVHESVQVQGTVGTLRHPMLHYTYNSLSDFLQRLERYSTLAARELHKQGKKPRWGELVWRPALTFAKLYFLKLGFLAGRDGYTLAYLYSVYTFVKYAKARELWQRSGQDNSYAD